jgi:hypothetical protein
LQSLPTSEVLWLHYCELYSRVGTEEEVRAVFENCVGLLPNSIKVLVLYFRWEPSFSLASRGFEILRSRLLALNCSHLGGLE